MSAPWKTYGEWGREETHWEQCFVWGFGEMTVSTLLDDALWEEGHVTFLTVVSLILRAAPGITQACQCIANDWISEWTNECEDSKSVVLFLGVSDAMPQRLGTARLCCSVTQSCLTLCNTMDCSTPGSSALHYLRIYSSSRPYIIYIITFAIMSFLDVRTHAEALISSSVSV